MFGELEKLTINTGIFMGPRDHNGILDQSKYIKYNECLDREIAKLAENLKVKETFWSEGYLRVVLDTQGFSDEAILAYILQTRSALSSLYNLFSTDDWELME